jgi:hypothetical protein
MFSNWISSVKLLDEDKNKGLIAGFPLPIRRGLISQMVSYVKSDARCSALLVSKSQMDWTFEVLGQAFSLPLDDADVIQNTIDIYRNWMQGIGRPTAFVENSQVFFQDMVKHTSLLFETRDASGAALERHLVLCATVLELLLWMGREKARSFTAETWQVVLHVLLGVTDATIRGKRGIEELIPLLLKCVLELWMRSGLQSQSLWDTLSTFYVRWADLLIPVQQWVAVTGALNKRVLRILYGPLEGTSNVAVGWCDASSSTLDMDDEAVFFLWDRMLHVLGNPCNIKNPDVFLQAISGISSMCDGFSLVGSVEPEVGKGEQSPVIPNPPATDNIVQIFGVWLFEAVSIDREEMKQGRAVAYGCLCRLFCRKISCTASDVFLARFYSALRHGLAKHDSSSLEAILFHGQSFFAFELPGSRVLIPIFLNFIENVLSRSSPYLFRADHRRAAITILGSILSVANHFIFAAQAVSTADDSQSDTYVLTNYYMSVKSRIRDCLLEWLKHESDSTCLQMMLWCIVVFTYEESSRGIDCAEQVVMAISELLLITNRWPIDVCICAFRALSSITAIPGLRKDVSSKYPVVAVQSLCMVAENMITATLATQRKMTDGEESLVEEAFYAVVDWAVAFSKRLLAGGEVVVQIFHCIDLSLSSYQYGTKPESVTKDDTSDKSDTKGASEKAEKEKMEKEKRQTLSADASRKSAKPGVKSSTTSPASKRIQDAALYMFYMLMSATNNFPTKATAERVSTLIDDDMGGEEDSKCQPNVNFFLLSYQNIISVVERGRLDGQIMAKNCPGTDAPHATVLVRNMTGRYSWNLSMIKGRPVTLGKATDEIKASSTDVDKRVALEDRYYEMLMEDCASGSCTVSTDRLRADLRALAADRAVIDTGSSASPTLDSLDGGALYDELPSIVGGTRGSRSSTPTTELLPNVTVKVNLATAIDDEMRNPSGSLDPWARSSHIALPHRNSLGENENMEIETDPSLLHHSRLFVSHTGLVDRSFRSEFQRLDAGQRLFRSLRMLDRTSERECHKIGVIYVGQGQELQHEILENSSGSPEYNRFLQALGWVVDVSQHTGFLGGLDPDSTGRYTPYFADHKSEVVFHVPTMMPTKEGDKQQIAKKRHVGNDHVHIVYSDHHVDYRVKTIRSQFNFVHIVAYPLPTGLFRIRIHTKEGSNIPPFGPLLNNMVVSAHVLGDLVRQTAVQATRVVRFMQTGYRRPFPTRKELIDEVATRSVDEMMEDKYYVSLFNRPENKPGYIDVPPGIIVPRPLEFPNVFASRYKLTHGAVEGKDSGVHENPRSASPDSSSEFVNPSFRSA